MLITFFNVRSIVPLEGEEVSRADYVEILTILHVAVLRNRLELWRNNCFLLQEDFPAQQALCLSHVPAARSNAELERTTYSPDLAPR